jgi:CO/xanthine dehydrogenase Mo-binding subunit/aerobic-type carbon monoxide dehydrogenase small subunit (CoxS/CutS family)
MTREADNFVRVQLTINGRRVEQEIPAQTTLQEFLHHRLKFREVRYGCGEGVCGACAVLLDGEPVASCLLFAAQADGREITTARGLDNATHHADLLREHLLAREAFQCGYCACGMLVSAAHHLSAGNDQTAAAIRRALSGHLCRCTGYEQIVEAVVATSAGGNVPPVKYPRDDLRGKLDGSLRYPTDLHVDNTLVGRILWSEWPSAKIIDIDTREAEAIPGVEAVLTHKDIPGKNLSGANVFVEDQPLFAVDRVRSMAEVIAVVAARSEIAAAEAIRRIRVRYEPLPPVTDVLAALQPEAPQIGARGNVISQFTEIKGDVDAAFRQADLIVEETYRCDINDHACMELEGGSGWLEGDTLVLVIPAHSPYTARRAVARALKIREEKIRIIAPRLGGSFGKYLVTSIEGYLALLVQKTRQPVRLVLDRQEALRRANKRHPFAGRYRLGLKRDGAFLALEAEVTADAGAYVSLTPAVISIFAAEAAGAYEIPNLKILARGVLTNNLVTAPMRGFGSQQISFGIECIVEKAARELGIDPGVIRQKNYLTARRDGRGQKIPSSKICLDKTMEAVVRRLGPRPEPPPGWRVGRGLASIHAKYGYPYGFVDRFLARVAVDQNGRFTVESDLSDAGTGIASGMSRLVANYFGLKKVPAYVLSQDAVDDPSGFLFSRGRRPSRFRAGLFRFIERRQTLTAGGLQLILARQKAGVFIKLMRILARPVNFFNKTVSGIKTRLFPFGVDSFIPRISGSRSILMAGAAALNAAERFKKSALAKAARLLETSADQLEVDDDGIHHRSDLARRVTWAALAKQAGGTLAAVGEAHLPEGALLDPATGNQIGPVDHMDGSHGCDLAVNLETGEVRILRYVACHDVGRILDDETIRGQLLGGIVMGIGQALFEHIEVGGGKVQLAGLHDYLVPTSLDAPSGVEIELIESGEGLGPDGAKGVGEAGAVAAPIAVANALYDALGAQLTRIPATPEDIVNLL